MRCWFFPPASITILKVGFLMPFLVSVRAYGCECKPLEPVAVEGRKKFHVQTAAGMSPALPWVSRIRLWGQAKLKDTFPGSLWLWKLVLHLEKMLLWNVYSLWAEADADPAHKPRTSTRMFVALSSAAGPRAPDSLREQHSWLDVGWWAPQGRHTDSCFFLVGPGKGHLSASCPTSRCA